MLLVIISTICKHQGRRIFRKQIQGQTVAGQDDHPKETLIGHTIFLKKKTRLDLFLTVILHSSSHRA